MSGAGAPIVSSQTTHKSVEGGVEIARTGTNPSTIDEDQLKAVWLEYRATNDQHQRDRLILTYSPLVKYVAGRLSVGLPGHDGQADLFARRLAARHEVGVAGQTVDVGLAGAEAPEVGPVEDINGGHHGNDSGCRTRVLRSVS